MKNIAFIDGQNLHMGTLKDNWHVDPKKLRTYLKENFSVEKAYYFIGYMTERKYSFYRYLEDAGFTIVFKQHSESLKGEKKGNVDTDVVFEIMRYVIEGDFDKIVIISGDGDYKKVIDYLISKEKFEKILFPSKKRHSSLYRQLNPIYYDFLKRRRARKKIEIKR